MASKPSWKYYKRLGDMSPLRAIAESVFNGQNATGSPRVVSAAEVYKMACRLPHVTVTDLPIHKGSIKRLGLPADAKVINDNHGDVVGRSAEARVFYNRVSPEEQNAIEAMLREAVYEMQVNHDLIICEAVVGLHPDMMVKARLCAPETDASNMFNWLANFNPLSAVPEYDSSRELDVPDILFVAYPDWEPDLDYLRRLYPPWFEDPLFHRWFRGCVVVDEVHKTIFNLGLRYFGERKKGTLTMAWTAGMDLGAVAAHGSIKEIDFSHCPGYEHRGKQVISFYGLSGSGKSSHGNSHDNGGTLPQGAKVTIAHDDAFQIDYKNRVCYVWEPSLFDKTDARELDHPDWEYLISTQNMLVCEVDGKRVPYGQDVRNKNGRAIFARELLGATTDSIGFPHHVNWLLKDTTLPPIIRITDKALAVAMGATLMTKRTAAENVSLEEMKKLKIVPFANPFRVYELWRDCEGYMAVFEAGANCYAWNAGGNGLWRSSDEDQVPIPLQTSLHLHTLVLTGEIEWEDHPYIEGAQVPAPSIDKFIPGYYETYDLTKVQNKDAYLETLAHRFQQRREFLESSDLQEKPELLKMLVDSLKLKV